eukprot:1050305-Pyramimonas_sp.AAC.1
MTRPPNAPPVTVRDGPPPLALDCSDCSTVRLFGLFGATELPASARWVSALLGRKVTPVRSSRRSVDGVVERRKVSPSRTENPN